MNNLRRLILLNAFLLFLVGFCAFSAVSEGQPYQEMTLLKFLAVGIALLAFALMLAVLSPLGDWRKVALWLSAANVIIGLGALNLPMSIWGKPLGWLLLLVPFGLAALLARAGLRRLRSAEIAAEVARLQIPGEMREALLLQVGEAAAQEERNRLARDLHDSIKQQLFSINVGAATAQERWESDPEGARAALADVRRSAREAMVEMQALLHQLRPRALGSTVGLVEALREQGEALGYRTGAQVTVELGPEIPDDRLSSDARESLFRIAQEALANVARHARARKVRILLGRMGDSAFLRIEDDGQGFHPGEERSGMGLRNIRERVESLRGILKVESAPAAGTTVAVTFPLAPPPPKLSPIEEVIRTDWIMTLNLTIPAVFLAVRRLMSDSSRAGFWEIFWISFLAFNIFQYHRRARRALEISRDENPAPVATLQYLRHRNFALAFLVAAGWTLWTWKLGNLWGQWAVAWLVATPLCTGLTMLELVRLHRVTEERRRWWSMTLSSNLSLWIFLLISLSIFGDLAFLKWLSPGHSLGGQPFETVEILFLLLVAAVFLYIRTRQPRSAGAPS